MALHVFTNFKLTGTLNTFNHTHFIDEETEVSKWLENLSKNTQLINGSARISAQQTGFRSHAHSTLGV